METMMDEHRIYRETYNATLRGLIYKESSRSKIQKAQEKARQAAENAVKKARKRGRAQ
jgi:hypothetical protein